MFWNWKKVWIVPVVCLFWRSVKSLIEKLLFLLDQNTIFFRVSYVHGITVCMYPQYEKPVKLLEGVYRGEQLNWYVGKRIWDTQTGWKGSDSHPWSAEGNERTWLKLTSIRQVFTMLALAWPLERDVYHRSTRGQLKVTKSRALIGRRNFNIELKLPLWQVQFSLPDTRYWFINMGYLSWKHTKVTYNWSKFTGHGHSHFF